MEIALIAERVSASHQSALPIKVEAVNAYPGLNMDPTSAAVTWANEMSGDKGLVKVPFGTEAGVFASINLKTVVIGPGDIEADGHKPDEGIHKTELAACTVMMENILRAQRG